MRVAIAFFVSMLMFVPPLARADEPLPAKPPASSAQQLDQLFAELAKATSADEAQALATRIEGIFRQSGSATVELLMARGQSALQAGDTATARKVIESVTKLAPDYAEGWHIQAQLQAAAGDDAGALLSLQKSVALNPRSFSALAGLAEMLGDYGDKKGALALYRKVLVLNPMDERAIRAVRRLAREVEGEKI